MKKIKKPWGQEIIIENNKFYSLKKLTMNKQIDMITFLQNLKNDKKKIIAFPVYEGWLDLGNRKNLKKFLR